MEEMKIKIIAFFLLLECNIFQHFVRGEEQMFTKRGEVFSFSNKT